MNIRFDKTSPSKLQIGAIYTAIGFLGFLLAQLGDRLLHFIPPCLFKSWSGLPCPTCGATRTGIALAHFHIVEAFLENPLFFLLFMTLFLWGMNTIIGIVKRKNLVISLSLREKKLVQILLISAIIVNWAYLVLRTVLKSSKTIM